MRVAHIAIWTERMDVLAAFYERFFGGRVGQLYRSASRPFESRFIEFSSGARLELMRVPGLAPAVPGDPRDPRLGLAHVAFSAGSEKEVDRLTAELDAAGHTVLGKPRRTGDGYYESVVLDPEGNIVEVTA